MSLLISFIRDNCSYLVGICYESLANLNKKYFYPRQITAFTDRLLCKRKLFPLILSSSVVERSAVNRFVVGSNPAWGVYKNKVYRKNRPFQKIQ